MVNKKKQIKKRTYRWAIEKSGYIVSRHYTKSGAERLNKIIDGNIVSYRSLPPHARKQHKRKK